jgi:hypothetical protein
MSGFLAPFIVPVAVFVGGLITRELALAAKWAVNKLRANPKTALLAEAVSVAEDALDASIGAAAKNADQGAKIIAAASLDAAKTTVKANAADLVAAAQGEVAVLVGVTGPTTATTPDGGASVNLPTVGGK